MQPVVFYGESGTLFPKLPIGGIMNLRIALPVALLLLTSSVMISELGAQTKSDLPAGWDEPTDLPQGAIRLEDVGGRPVAPSQPATSGDPVVSPPAAVRDDAAIAPSAAGPSEPLQGSSTRDLPVDMNFAPPEAGGMSPVSPPPPAAASAAPVSSPSANVPAQASSAGYSDLPAGWNEETSLPDGAVKLEDVRSPYEGMSDRAVTTSPQSASAPTMDYQPPVVPAPVYEPSLPEPVQGESKKEKYKAPSRWEGK